MKRQHLLLLGIAAPVLVIGAMVFGFSTSTLFALAFLVLCPLMMMLMMGGHGIGHGSGEPHQDVEPPVGRSGEVSR